MPDQAAVSPSALGILAERLGPLPLINHFLARMGLLELLEQHVPTTGGRSAVTHADDGRDPRAVKAEATAADMAKRDDAKRQTVTVAEAWAAYMVERRPFWGDRHYQDHVIKSAPGGTPGRRGPTLPGPLAPLMPMTLRDLDAATIEAWAAREAKTRPTVARLAWRLLKAFLGWCAEQPAHAGILPATNPAKTKKAREVLGKPGTKSDVRPEI